MTKTINKLKPYTRLKPAVLALQIQKGVEDAWVAVDENGRELARASTIESAKQAAPEAKDYQPVLDLPGMENQPLTMGDYVIDDGDGIYWTLSKKDFEEQYVEGAADDTKDDFAFAKEQERSSSQSTGGSKSGGDKDTGSIPKSGENGYVPYDGHTELAIDHSENPTTAPSSPTKPGDGSPSQDPSPSDGAENFTSASTQQNQGQTEQSSQQPATEQSSGKDPQTSGLNSSEISDASESKSEQTSTDSSTSATGQTDTPTPPVVTSTSGQPGDADNPTPAPSSEGAASTTSLGDTSTEGQTATGAEPSLEHPVSAESQAGVKIPDEGAPNDKLATTAQGKTVEITEATRLDAGSTPTILAEVGQPSASDNGQNLEQFAADGEVLDAPTPDPIHQDKGQDPLDHDNNGRKGGSKAKAKRAAAK